MTWQRDKGQPAVRYTYYLADGQAVFSGIKSIEADDTAEAFMARESARLAKHGWTARYEVLVPVA